MRMIYIPPFAMLDESPGRVLPPMQLMLPHLVKFELYSNHFKKMAGLNKYIILDNGANEGATTSMMDLSKVADDYGVHELVLPDVMGSFEETLSLTKFFLNQYERRIPTWTKLGFVLHGVNANEVLENFERLRRIKVIYNKLGVLYIPRMLVTEGNLTARIDIAKYILTEDSTKPIHFLGASPLWLDEIAQVPRHVRSMDTSAPYVYAKRGVSVATGRSVARDHATYFRGTMNHNQKRLALENCKYLDSLVQM
jgi:hypothetical protein